MDIYTVIRLAAIGLLLVCSATFSGSETALFSLSRLQLLGLKEERHPKCKSIRGLLDRPRRLLISLIMGNEFSNVVASTIATSTAVTAYGEGGKWLAFLIMTASVLLFGDLIPRSIALANPVRFSALISEPLGLFVRAVTPLRKLVRIVTDGILRILPADTTAGQPFFIESDFLQLVEKGHEEGVVEEIERDLIRRVIAFGDTGVNEIMTPRMDMFTVPIDIGISDLVESIKTHHFSRIPVYDAELDNIVGIFHAKDILTIDLSEEAWNKNRFTSLLRSPCFVPMSKKVDVLFKEFQTKRIHVAIVVDEYGGISGLVTMEDLLEELFGEIYDEFDKTEIKYKRLDGGSLLISPRLSIEEFNTLMNSDIPSDELATMGGFVFSLFGRIPSEREKTYYQNLLFIPTKVRGARILEIRVERMGSTG